MTQSPIPPVRRSIDVSWSQEEAFRRFTEEFGGWWPWKTHSIGGRKVRTIGFECRVGGQIYEELDDGRCFQWGRVTVWEPPERVAFTWHPSKDESTAQDVEVRFHRREYGTEVELVSSGWEKLGPKAARARKGYDVGWGSVLAVYAGRRSGAMVVFAIISGAITAWLRVTGRLDSEIDKSGGRIPTKSQEGTA